MTTLDKAMAAFVASPTHNDRTAMNVPAWAATYGCEADDIRTAYEAAMTRHSQQQHHNGESVE